jgi:hypothetical protein
MNVITSVRLTHLKDSTYSEWVRTVNQDFARIPQMAIADQQCQMFMHKRVSDNSGSGDKD